MASFKAYLSESYNELVNKVSWPTWKELQSSALLVLLATLIVALVVFLMDFIFGVHNMGNSNFWKGLLGFIYKFIA